MWNPVAPEIIENPFPFWAWLRKEAPVWEVPDAGYFTISRYADLMEVSRDSETFSSELLAVVQRDDSGRARLRKTDLVGRPQSRVLGVSDGDMHTRHRRAVAAFLSTLRPSGGARLPRADGHPARSGRCGATRRTSGTSCGALARLGRRSYL